MKRMMRNYKVGKKLVVSFGTIIVAFVISVAIAVTCIIMINNNMTTFYEKPYDNSKLQLSIRKDIQFVGRQVLWATTTDNKEDTADHIRQAREYENNVSGYISQLKENFPDKSLVEKLEKAEKYLSETSDKVIELAELNRNEEALELYNTDYNDATKQMQDVLEEIGHYADNVALNSYTSANTAGKVSTFLMLLIGVFTIMLSIYFAIIITKAIREPILELEGAAENLKKGILDVDITYSGDDELGNLAESFRESCSFMKDVIEDAGYLLDEISKGNFKVKTKNEAGYVGEFNSLLSGMRKLIRELSQTLQLINEGSDQVAIGSAQLADNAMGVAEGATEQAGAIEQLTATIENVATLSARNLEGASTACAIMVESEREAEKGRDEMRALVEAMERISATSKEISNIISAIEDIASQTNMLSLNASIEAARAGEAGRGFAVVADQIGKLASGSAQSAVNTRELIVTALSEIENGNAIMEKTAGVMDKIISSMSEFARLAKASTEASKVESDMLEQIKTGIGQISDVVQINSAAAEETSATSEELSAQSENLKSMVGKFQLLG